MLSDVTRFLRCPVCRAAFRHGGPALLCSNGHGFDIARQGYVNLLTGRPGHRDVDTPAMVGARDRFLTNGHFGALADLLAVRSREAISELADDACVLDVGAGTGYYLARVLGSCAGRPGIALDASKHAARRAARAHGRVGAVVADAWQQIPTRSGAAGVALVVFAPRNAPELHRVLNGRGRLLVVTPAPRHLQEIREPLGLLGIGDDKNERLSAQLKPFFVLTGRETVERRLRLGKTDVRSLVMMGPNAWHITPDELDQRTGQLAAATGVTASFTVSSYEPIPA
jgi:23S rRNA (guanine745-N1)-methyltransferase